jgi:cytochrome c peroxidase
VSKAGCASCHAGSRLTDDERLHRPEETGMDGAYAARTATGRYRTTPLRGLWQNAPYFHDGSAATLDDVVEHYDDHFDLGLTAGQKADLVQYLLSL